MNDTDKEHYRKYLKKFNADGLKAEKAIILKQGTFADPFLLLTVNQEIESRETQTVYQNVPKNKPF